MKKGFFESYSAETAQKERQIIVQKKGALAVIGDFFTSLVTAIMYICMVILSSIGLTTLLNRPLRDMLFEIVTNMIN